MSSDDLLGCWVIDANGNIREGLFPVHEPTKEDVKINLYTLFVYYSGFFSKKIQRIEVCIFNSKPRNKEAEMKLKSYIRSAIQSKIDNEMLDRSGGIEKLIKELEWNEWWE